MGIIGAGLQGRRRAHALSLTHTGHLVGVASAEAHDAKRLAAEHKAIPFTDTEELIADPRIDAVLVCTPPDSHKRLSIAALDAGKHVLCEKPLARTVLEAEEMVRAARRTGRILWCGWNHRFHPAIQEAKRRFDAGDIGRPLFGRGIYGIGARPGTEDEWRADPAVAAGGHLTEQGIHLVDLYNWILGDFHEVTAMTQQSLVPMGGMEDSGFVLLRRRDGVVVSVHSALTQWVNRFDFELFGELGYVRVQGLGGSYGVEELTVGFRDDTGPFSAQVIQFRGADASWGSEWSELARRITELAGAPCLPTDPALDGSAGLTALRNSHTAYESNSTGRTLPLDSLGVLRGDHNSEEKTRPAKEYSDAPFSGQCQP
ncbi:Gfo/Idh/MocA family protein [Streptomyces sp. NPDC020747]|uniref:Gfo/Idh/MocA family protein n=1 Tax=Streptomyces sp. NPDC020747 TaxID=3365086 RepID=UPI0037912BAC